MTGEVKTAKESKPATPSTTATSPLPVAAPGVDTDLRDALTASYAKKGLPLQLSTTFLDAPTTGPMLNASTQISTAGLDYGPDGNSPATVDIGGMVYNDQGKPAGGFKNRITVNPLSNDNAAAAEAGVVYNHKLPLKPGIYQVRVAAKEPKTGRVGSASHWIEIPDLSGKKLTLSSLLIGGQFVGANAKQTTGGGSGDEMQFSVDRRFLRGAHLSVLTIIYNAARGSSGSGAIDLDAQIKIIRGRQAIISSPVRKLALEPGGDAARIPYGADIKLNTLSPGRYLLRIEITDRIANITASQESVFEVE